MKEAERLGVRRRDEVSGEETTPESGTYESPASMTKDIYTIPSLVDATVTKNLVEQAKELVKYSKETHWVDKSVTTSVIELSELELLAWNIYQFHIETYKDILSGNARENDSSGAEWWVQVKPVDEPSPSTTGIDLHYDKDEALAESFGLGSFPTLSTVTYLTCSSSNSPPTVVFDHVYTQGEEEVMGQLLVSRPRLGKHLVFDGRLLHGAPYHPKLQPLETPHDQVSKASSIRVTFLVNIWKDWRPANVKVLDEKIRQSLLELRELCDVHTTTTPIHMDKLICSTVQLDTEDQLPDQLQERIELPFVTDKGALGTNDMEHEGGLVVVTFPPPPTEDNVLVNFGPGMQAYLEYIQDDEEQETAAKNIVEELDFEPPNKQSDYV